MAGLEAFSRKGRAAARTDHVFKQADGLVGASYHHFSQKNATIHLRNPTRQAGLGAMEPYLSGGYLEHFKLLPIRGNTAI